MGFRRLDYLDLTDWDGAPRNHRLDPLWDELEQKTGRAPNFDLKAVRAYEETWRRFGAPSLKAFALAPPLEIAEGDRNLPDRTAAKEIPANPPTATAKKDELGNNHLWMLAAQEWPAVRDSRDIARLRRFEASFTGTYYAGEAQALREAIEAELQTDKAKPVFDLPKWFIRKKLDMKGRIQIPGVIAHGTPEGWFLPGAGKSEWFKDLEGGPEMVVVPAGSFMMGSPENELERESWQKGTESPNHRVMVPRPFAVGRFAITQVQFAIFDFTSGPIIEDGVHVLTEAGWKFDPKKSWCDPGFAQDNSHPVVCVNWNDAQAYIGWLNGQFAGRPYRLLSEAEWEYARRAGTCTPFWWGSSITQEQANYNGNIVYGVGGLQGGYREKTMPVESFQPIPWGLYQVHGNVWEWCEDCWNDSYEDKPHILKQNGGAWTTGDDKCRVLRGGSWSDKPADIRAAYRGRHSTGNRYNAYGFRVARTLIPAA